MIIAAPFAAERRRRRLRSGRTAAGRRDVQVIAANSMGYTAIHGVLSAHADNCAMAMTSIKAPSRNGKAGATRRRKASGLERDSGATE